MNIPEPEIGALELSNFYLELGKIFQDQNIFAALTGGQACIQYKLSQFSKDSDWIVDTNKTEKIINILSELKSPHKTKGKYNTAAGAPLHPQWVNHGWSSHIYYPDLQKKPGARIDIFGNPPRVENNLQTQNFSINKDALACMKKTQREKDWPFVEQLGIQLCINNDPNGLLHLQTTESLLHYSKTLPLSETLLQKRPLLQELNNKNLIEKLLLAERELWKIIDKNRIAQYLQAWKPYGKELYQDDAIKKLPLIEQHSKLITIAEALLPKTPFPSNTNPNEFLFEKSFEQLQNLFNVEKALMPPIKYNKFV
jgi:hypothetical protein